MTDYLKVPISVRLSWFKGSYQENRHWTGAQRINYYLKQLGPNQPLP